MTREWSTTGPRIPSRLYMAVDRLSDHDAETLAVEAVQHARTMAPKLSGRSARNLSPISGSGWFGLHWTDEYVWFQDQGIRPFTMRNLAGKTVPMWINDPTGEERRKNPKAQTRVTADGRTQILIFRKAAPLGTTKTIVRDGEAVEVPRAYPGAPGRINEREAPQPFNRPGKIGGRIAETNVGVRWRHPGLLRKGFLRNALVFTAERHGVPIGIIRDDLGRIR